MIDGNKRVGQQRLAVDSIRRFVQGDGIGQKRRKALILKPDCADFSVIDSKHFPFTHDQRHFLLHVLSRLLARRLPAAPEAKEVRNDRN